MLSRGYKLPFKIRGGGREKISCEPRAWIVWKVPPRPIHSNTHFIIYHDEVLIRPRSNYNYDTEKFSDKKE